MQGTETTQGVCNGDSLRLGSDDDRIMRCLPPWVMPMHLHLHSNLLGADPPSLPLVPRQSNETRAEERHLDRLESYSLHELD